MSNFNITWQPFNNLNNREFNDYLNPLYCDTDLDNLFDVNHLNRLVFDQFQVDSDNYNSDLDPDSNFFIKNFDITRKCEYCFLDSWKIPQVKDTKSFSVLNLNINSLPRNFDSFLTHFRNILNSQLDVVTFCETKMSDDIDELYNIEGFNKFTLNNHRSSGGLAIFVRKSFSDVLLEMS